MIINKGEILNLAKGIFLALYCAEKIRRYEPLMSRIKIIGIIILTLAVIAPEAALADWKVYYTGRAAGMFGSAGRGSFATHPQCDAYRNSSAGFERSNSYCSGFDTPSYTPPAPSRPSGDGGAAAREQEKQRQLQLQREQKERELELARQQKFTEEKDQLLETLKGTGTSTLGLKTGTGPVAGCIEEDQACVLNGTACCAPYSCMGEFPNTYCGSLKGTSASTSAGTLGLKGASSGTLGPKTGKDDGLDELEEMNAAWMENQKKLIQQRLEEPNKWCSAIYTSLKTKAPPLPYKKFNELQPGDVLLIEHSGTMGWAINKGDNLLSGDKVSNASHTVLYLKEINGKKFFLENIPGEGPRIIGEDEFLTRYGPRGVQVAKLAQPLDPKQAKELFAAAVEIAAKNRSAIANNLFGTKWLGTNYGPWGKENVVCSEADWALLKTAGREIPKSNDRIKVGLGIDVSPADFFNNEQYFLVSPLGMPQ